MPALSYQYSTNSLAKDQIGQAIDEMMQSAKNLRWPFERRWYDNNFFYDGFHFRYLSRTQNKIVDLSQVSTVWAPMRSIPKASRQIHGVANLLSSRKFVPVIYPEKINSSKFPPINQVDPQTGQPVQQANPEYKKAMEEAKRIAKSSGHWLSEEYKNQNLVEKLAFMIILTAKHGISFLQVWPDAVEESLKTMVFDAFDVYVVGSINELEDSPFVIKTQPRRIAEIKSDERFDKDQLEKISPDNRNASSDIKEAYSKARYGGMPNADSVATVIEKEAFIKEYLNDENEGRIKLQDDGGEILKRRKKYDPVIRHTFVAGNITLKDEYLNLPSYPLVDLRFEPGPMYQVPLIERFIPQNKSLDLVVSRVERFLHTMVTGSWSIKSGEPAEPNNTAGGQIFKYNTIPPVQNVISSVPPFVFNFMSLLESFIDEQGVSTSALAKIPKGVKANAAIESLKETEFQNLAIPMERVKGVVKRVSEKMLDYADDYFVKPQTVYYLEKGEPQYFDVIGASALQKRKDLKIDEGQPLDAIPLKREYRVDIEVESGLAYTREAQKTAAKDLGDYLVQLSQLGLVSPEVIKVYFGRLLEIYQYGSSSEIMEAMDQFGAEGQMTETQIEAMKIALVEVIKDMQQAGILPTSEQRIEEGKFATAQAIKDTGLTDNKPQDPMTQVEIEAKLKEIEQEEEEHRLKLQKLKQDIAISDEKADVDIRIKKVQAAQGLDIKEEQAQQQMRLKAKESKNASLQRQQSKNNK